MRESDNDKSSVIITNTADCTLNYFRQLATKPKTTAALRLDWKDNSARRLGAE